MYKFDVSLSSEQTEADVLFQDVNKSVVTVFKCIHYRTIFQIKDKRSSIFGYHGQFYFIRQRLILSLNSLFPFGGNADVKTEH